jgi:hypothetical protein
MEGGVARRLAGAIRWCFGGEDGHVDTINYVGSYYPYFTVFYVLDFRGILVFCLLI